MPSDPHWIWILVIFGLATGWLYHLSVTAPTLDNAAASPLKFPSSLEDLHSLVNTLTLYKSDHISYIVILFCSAYLYKQTFAIPGSVFLNLLAGALFGAEAGFIVTSILTACGATNCYLLSKNFGKPVIIRRFKTRLEFLQEKIEANMDSLFYFLLFVRLFPMSPNWFLNMASPILNIPIHYFFFSVLIGLMPYNFICVQTGCVLSSIKSVNDIFTFWILFKLLLVALVSVMPGILIKWWKGKTIKMD